MPEPGPEHPHYSCGGRTGQRLRSRLWEQNRENPVRIHYWQRVLGNQLDVGLKGNEDVEKDSKKMLNHL